MAKFVFNLQNILNIKMNLERQAKSVYAQMQHRLNEEEEKLDAMFRRKKELEDYYRTCAEGTIDVREMMDARKAIDFVRDEIHGQLVVIKRVEKDLEIARARLNDAMKERKTYEKLREHAFEEFLQEMNSEEKKEIDELVSYRFNENGAG